MDAAAIIKTVRQFYKEKVYPENIFGILNHNLKESKGFSSGSAVYSNRGTVASRKKA